MKYNSNFLLSSGHSTPASLLPFSTSTKIPMEQVIFLNKCTSFKLLITNRHVKAAYLSPIVQTVAMVWFFPTLILLITCADQKSFLFGIVHHSSIICCWLKQCLNFSIYNFLKIGFCFLFAFPVCTRLVVWLQGMPSYINQLNYLY